MRDRTSRSSPADAPARVRRHLADQRPINGERATSHDRQLLTLQRLVGNAAVGRLISTSSRSSEVRRFYALPDEQNRQLHEDARTGTWLGYDWIDLPDPRDVAEYPFTVPGRFPLGTYLSAWPVRNLYARSKADADRAAGIATQPDLNDGGIERAELGREARPDLQVDVEAIGGRQRAPNPFLTDSSDDIELATRFDPFEGVLVDDSTSHARSSEVDTDDLVELPRVLRQGAGGTTIGDLCNSLGVIGSVVTVAMGDEGATATGILGILGGLGVLSGGISQVVTGETTEALVQGWSNVFSGGFGTISGILTLAGSTVLADISARFSLLTWSVAEFINFGVKAKAIVDGTADNRDKVLAVCSLLKGIGGGTLAVLAWPALGEVLLLIGIVLTAAGVVGGVGAGLYKLGQICCGLDGENPNA